ncbi:MAG: sporulation protein YqfD [Eubacteriales bacterium]|nr:sporulation protein YqfD [Eubacteriales bacterium]
MVADWIRLAGGMLDIRVRGAELERFLNLCAQERIALRRPKRTDIDEMQAVMSLRDFYRLSRVRKRTRCRVHIVRRRGLPFVWKKLRRRYALGLGLLLVCAACYLLSTRVWVIETEFDQGVDAYAVMQELEQLGIDIGTKSADIDARAVKLHMMTALDALKYFSINVDGNVITVQAATATEAPDNESKNGVHSVVALKDGIVEKMSVWRGTEQCEIGDAVIRGQVLVDALVEQQGELDETRLVDANAAVWASTRYYTTRKMALEAGKKYKSGESKRRYAVCFGKTRINLFFSSSLTQGNCDRIITTKEIRLNDFLALPISLCCETIQPYETEQVYYDAEQLRAKLEYGTRRSVERQINEGNICSMQADLSTENDAAVLRSVVWCYEQIGERVEDGRTEADLPEETEEDEEAQ